jgi:hypothetical protein
MRFISAASIILLLLASCSDARVKIKDSYRSPINGQIVKLI